MKYFKDCKTAEDLKKAYRKAAVKLHPDNGGDIEEFKSMQAEYEAAWERLKDVHATKEGKTYESNEKTTEKAADFMDIIEKIIFMEGVKIEIIGSWVWLSGNTMIYKDQIKAAGFWWSKSKRAWYYNGSTKKTKRRGRYSMNQLREIWETEEIKTKNNKKKLTA